MENKIEHFRQYREKMNAAILEKDNLVIKRIFNLDTNAYREGSLDQQSKELIGLCTSLVLRCDDCVKYHLEQCYKLKISTAVLMEAMAIANVVGGTIVIPHLRKAVEYWDMLRKH
ncbi:MAG: carboxymuconolactone decarboxylase family protein [Candidatus Delongbacteria bacterium]|jgi:AhpD family alkylhydroperoxidase|nr:carboxymuconolactone decarboxylase family protein [Candidatus Delongbacteria bacterium]